MLDELASVMVFYPLPPYNLEVAEFLSLLLLKNHLPSRQCARRQSLKTVLIINQQLLKIARPLHTTTLTEIMEGPQTTCRWEEICKDLRKCSPCQGPVVISDKFLLITRGARNWILEACFGCRCEPIRCLLKKQEKTVNVIVSVVWNNPHFIPSHVSPAMVAEPSTCREYYSYRLLLVLEKPPWWHR